MFAKPAVLCYDIIMNELIKNQIHTVVIEGYTSEALGVCRTRDGCTVLVKQEDAGDRGRLPDLDEIMIHLDKEDAQ